MGNLPLAARDFDDDLRVRNELRSRSKSSENSCPLLSAVTSPSKSPGRAVIDRVIIDSFGAIELRLAKVLRAIVLCRCRSSSCRVYKNASHSKRFKPYGTQLPVVNDAAHRATLA